MNKIKIYQHKENSDFILMLDTKTNILHGYNNSYGILSLKNNYETYIGSMNWEFKIDNCDDLVEHLVSFLNGNRNVEDGYNYIKDKEVFKEYLQQEYKNKEYKLLTEIKIK